MIAAIVPAAGRSQRMGRPKLILPVGGVSVIARVTTALRQGGADPVIVVVPPAWVQGAAALAAEAARAGGAVVVAPQPPPHMRASVELGLDRLAQMPAPATFLLVPGDCPGIDAHLVARVIARARAEPLSIVVPQARGHRGHPVALPWSLADEIRGLPADVGINYLVARHPPRVVCLEVDDPVALDDLDTPEDYRRWSAAALDEAGPGNDHEDGNREGPTVRVTVRLFALARQQTGRDAVALDVPEPATVAALKRALAAAFPELARLVPQLMIAINADYISDEERLIPPGAEVAAIPPVSGGGHPERARPAS
jgi:molybdopterin converting factor subunit 1